MRRQTSAHRLPYGSREFNIDPAETELLKLQQEYRIAERAKQEYSLKTQHLICRQMGEIQRLQDEREEILCSLRVCGSLYRWISSGTTQDLRAMLVFGDRIEDELEAQKHIVASLKDEILKWERKLAGRWTGGGTACLSQKSDNSHLQKTTCVLENKLDTGRRRFNKLLAKNGKLREELKTLQHLHEIRKDIWTRTSKCTAASEASVEIQDKQRMLKDETIKDEAQYITQKSNLERVISHNRNLKSFLGIKAHKRISQEISGRTDEHRKTPESKEWGLEAFEDAVNKILRETGERDLDKLGRTFTEMEEQSYASLNFVNYQHNEAENIREQITQLCDEMESFVAEEQRQQEEHQALLRETGIQQEASDQQMAAYQQRIVSVDKILDQLKKGVETMFHNIHCDSLVTYDELEPTTGIQDYNTMVYVGMVEDRINELLTLQSYLHSQENISQCDLDRGNLRTIAGQLLGICPPLPNLSSALETPSTEDDIDQEGSPLEQNEPISRESPAAGQ